MRKLIKIVIFIIVLLAIPIVWLWLSVKHEVSILAKSVLKTGSLTSDVFAIQDGTVNMYLIKSNDGYIAIDCAKNRENVLTGLQNLKIKPEEVKAVFLTHSDSDHTGAIDLFSNANVYISKAEEKLVKGEKYRTISWLKIPIRNRLNCKYNTLKDNQTISYGNRTIKCLLTPGHTPGSMCYLIDSKFLFTGDTLSLKNGEVKQFIELFNMNTMLEKESIKNLKKRLSGEKIDYIFTAHFGSSANYGKAFKSW